MEREADRLRDKTRKMTADGMEARSENLGDTGRADFSRRSERLREPMPGRELGGPPLSVHETIARHQNQAKAIYNQSDAQAESGPSMEVDALSDQAPAERVSRFVRSSINDRNSDKAVRSAQRRTAYNRRFSEMPRVLPPESSASEKAQAAKLVQSRISEPQTAEQSAEPVASASKMVPDESLDNPAFPDVPETEKKAPDPNKHTQVKKPSKLRFGKNDAPSDALSSKKLAKAQDKVERAAAKLNKTEKKLPPKRRLATRFEAEVGSKQEHLKGPFITHPSKVGANAASAYSHNKMYQVEEENVGTKAVHRGEMLAEGGLRAAYRLHKTAPYRKMERLGKKTARLNMKADYLQALHDNPKLTSNIFSRLAQKRKIQRQYAKTVREAKKTAQHMKNTVDIVGKAGQVAVQTAARHPAVFGWIAGLLLLAVLVSALVSACSNMVSGVGSVMAVSSYLAEDADIDSAELFYTEWETDLQFEIIDAKSSHPGFDEYRYSLGDIYHNPYALMAYLTARYRDFTYSGVEADLQTIFAEQYRLTFSESAETRYSDPDDADGDGDTEPYEWKILTVTLTAQPFTDVIAGRLSADQLRHYNLLMQTKGYRQYTGSPIDFNWLPYVSCSYGWRVHPITGAKDNHKAVDIAVPQGTEIHAANAGTVSIGSDVGGYGNYVIVTGVEGLVTKYAHCSEVLVTNGQAVSAGDVIARVGSTGQSTGPHLHFEVIRNGLYMNPLYFSLTNGSEL